MTTPLNPDFIISDTADLRSGFGDAHPIAIAKSMDRLDPHSRDFIARCPFICIGTQSDDGQADVSPRGDPRGFVHILDDKTILIPDRPGNNRLDTLENILSNPSVGIIFMIPGFDETLRINGQAKLTRDPALLAQMAVHDRVPGLAIAVTIDELFIHCAKAFRRAKLWDPTQHQDRSEMPSLIKIVMDQTATAPDDPAEQKKLDDGLEESYKTSMY